MYKNLPEILNLPELEKEILGFWKEDNTFEKSIKTKSLDRNFAFYEGPPTANGLPGIHHVISRTVKDVICRYKTMQGFRVERVAGWDTHGLPVEVEVEKTLGIKSKEEIIQFGSEKFNIACKNSIFKYLNEWELLTERMAYWIHLDGAYVTFHNEYIESVWWALKRFYLQGMMFKGFKIQPYCPVCESPLSSHEVAQGYVDLTDPSIYIKFKITSGKYKDSDFLVWTTTPWTLPSNVALAVNPKSLYVLISTESNNNFILAKDRLSVIKENYEIKDEIIGRDLENTEYVPLFKFFNLEKKAYYVTVGDFVTMEDGTGIVHIAPAYGEDDYQTGLKYNLPFLQAVSENGNFVKEAIPYAGKNFKESDSQITGDLKTAGRLYKKEMFNHSYPHCWRHKKPLMYFATDSWFIKTTSFKNQMIDYNRQINWYPPEVGTGRFGNWLEENKDWALSRDRFWGTPLPIWFCTNEDGNNYYEVIGSIEELKSKAVNFNEVYPDPNKLDLHKPYIDKIILKSPDGKEMKRIPEVIDCWFDSGSMPFAQFHYPFENKEKFESNYPADFIAEGLDQTRGWFYSLHAIGTFLFSKPAYKNLIVNGLILDKNGKKMSKSLGNVVNPFDMLDKFGADILRWYLVYSTPVWKSKLFNENDLVEIKNKFFDTLINTYRFFAIYSGMQNFSFSADNLVNVHERNEIDKWIVSKLNSLKKNYFSSLDNYDITKAARELFDFTVDELSNWYVRRNRKRFRSPENKKDMLSVFQTLYEVLYELVKMIAPVSPFLSEALFLRLTDEKISVHLTEFEESKQNYINLQLEEDMELAQKIVYVVRMIRVKNNLKVRQPLRQVLIPVLNQNQKTSLNRVRDIILEEINIKELNIIEGNSGVITKKAKPNFKSIGPKYGKSVKQVQKVITELTTDEISEIEKTGTLEKSGFNIASEDFEIMTENIEGWIVEREGNITVAVDTKLDEELINEGILREFISRVQNYRKNQNFNVNDRIRIYLKTENDLFSTLNNNLEKIKSEILCEEIVDSYNGEREYYKTDINDVPCEFIIEKIED
ncbi:MAG: isoleucine--tRNA ligase [Ignavibacteria bacterium]|nr:isoleucine--tRNA ligase [Ignavibacteria bacterium]